MHERERRETVNGTREGKQRVKVTRPVKSETTKKTRIDDTSAVPDEPTDHAVTRGRDVSLRCEGGHSLENHTVVLEWYWNHSQTVAATTLSDKAQTAKRVVVKYLDRKARAPTANRRSHSGVGGARRGVREYGDVNNHKV